jgi:hypothetical protein
MYRGVKSGLGQPSVNILDLYRLDFTRTLWQAKNEPNNLETQHFIIIIDEFPIHQQILLSLKRTLRSENLKIWKEIGRRCGSWII